MNKAISRFRLRIQDVEDENARFTNSDLYEYISFAVDELEMDEYRKGIYVDEGDFLNKSNGKPAPVTTDDIIIYVLKAQILLKIALKDIADRDNFSLSKNNLRVDTSQQSSDHKDSLEILEKQLKQYLYRRKRITGVRVE